jgi:AraC-like DNA-binding protein
MTSKISASFSRSQPRQSGWLTSEDKYIQASYPIAQLLDLALASDVPQHKLLRGTGIFVEDFASHSHADARGHGGVRMNIRQLAVLADNIAHYLPQEEIAARWGARLWPGFAGPFSQALAMATDLGDFLRSLYQYRHWLAPGLVPCLRVQNGYRILHWQNLFGLSPRAEKLLSEAYMTALVSVTREQCQKDSAEWMCFTDQCDAVQLRRMRVYCGEQTTAGGGGSFMAIPESVLSAPWAAGSARIRDMAIAQANTLTAGIPAESFAEQVTGYLANTFTEVPTLAETASHFGISSATLKRYLAVDGMRYQQVADQLRLRHSLELMHFQGLSNEAIADALRLGDGANFRRSFRRWTKLLPSDAREALSGRLPPLIADYSSVDHSSADHSSPKSAQSIRSHRQ